MQLNMIQVQRSNVQILLQKVKENGPISKRELQEITGYSWGFISQAITKLVELGYIEAEEEKESIGVGRKAEKFSVRKNRNFYLGVDLDGRDVVVVITDMSGYVIEKTKHTWTVFTKAYVIEKMFQIIDSYVEKYGDKNIIGLGFAVQGVVDVSTGVSMHIARIPDWKNVPLKQMAEERYEIDVMVVHDPDCLLKCESCFGVLKGDDAQDVLEINFNYGFGVGMSIMVNGQIYVGHSGRAGEIGHTSLGTHQNGRMERLAEHAQKKVGEIDTELLCDHLARSIVTASALFNPSVVVLYTMECDYKQELFQTIQKRFKEAEYDKVVGLRLSSLPREAKAVGAALIMIDRTIDEVI